MGDLAGQVALVTGGSRGVGRAICLELAGRGADIAFIYHNRDSLAEETAKAVEATGRRALALRLDISDGAAVDAAVARAVKELGPIDILAHAVGARVNWSPVRALGHEEWSNFLAVDLTGAFNAIRAALGHMHERGRGVIVAISSIAAQMCQPRNGQGAAAKAGLEALIRVVAREEGRHGIRANVVSIGLTDTDQAKEAFEMWGPEVTERIIAGIPLQRIGKPEEIARMVSFLAGEDGAYITGKVIQVDGGQIIAG